MLLTQTSQLDFEELCRLDVLGLVDTPQHDQGEVYKKFQEHLLRSDEGWYEAALLDKWWDDFKGGKGTEGAGY